MISIARRIAEANVWLTYLAEQSILDRLDQDQEEEPAEDKESSRPEQ